MEALHPAFDIAHLIQVALTPIFNVAITCIILSALFIALVVVMLFVNALLRWDLSGFIACMFILSMLALAAALLAFLVEVRIATRSLRIGIEEASRQG
jgi:Protein of unknown function (DUF2721)